VIVGAARLGGAHDAELVEAVLGLDLNGLALDAALGANLVMSHHEPRVGGAVTRFLVAPPGGLQAVEVPEGIRARIYREPGYVFTPLRRGADRAGAILVVAGSRAEAVAQAEDAANRVRFVTADAGALV
jgi:biotin carboxylase